MNEIGVRTEKEVEDQIDRANESNNDGGKYRGMSYEEGVRYALEWVLGTSDDKPMEDDEPIKLEEHED